MYLVQAIHDLSMHSPSVFVPAFAELLPSILTSLTHAPTLALRAMAAHALGGLALGASRLIAIVSRIQPKCAHLRTSCAEAADHKVRIFDFYHTLSANVFALLCYRLG